MSKIIFVFFFLISFLSMANDELGVSFEENQSWKESKFWKPILKLEDEQKYNQALKELKKQIPLLSKDSKKNEKNLILAIIKKYHYMMGLSQAETALKEFQKEKFPQSVVSLTLKNLYFAQLLKNYYHTYSWEINQRTHLEGKIEKKSVKQWSKLDLVNLINQSFNRIWELRNQLKETRVEYLGEFIKGGNYPFEMRKTLREVLTYFFVDYLKNTQFWSAEENNEKNKFELKRLMASEYSNSFAISSNETHPLLKISYLLNDLNSWLKKMKRSDSELESYYEKVRVFRQHYSSDKHREFFIEKIRAKIKNYTKYMWWSEGKYLIASLLEEMKYQLAKVDAYKVAKEGNEKFKTSKGAARCAYLMSKIASPDVSVNSNRWDLPDRKNIEINYKNWEHMYFKAYEYDVEKDILGQKNRVLPYYWRDLQKKLEGRKLISSWDVKLKPTKDYRTHKKIIKPEIKKNGFYIILASPKKDFAEHNNKIAAFFYNQSNLKLLKKNTEKGTLLKVVNALNGEIEKKAKVHLYEINWREGHRKAGIYELNEEGEFLMDTIRFQNSKSYMITLRKKNEFYFDDNVFNNYNNHHSQNTSEQSLIFTDRSIYRPKQKIHFKVLTYLDKSDLGKLPQIQPKKEIRVSLRDYNGEVVETANLTSNDFGTAAGSFIIPTGRALGSWSLRIDNGSGYQNIQVEEYKRPTFKVTFLNEDANQMVFGKKVKLSGNADYYLGTPVKEGKVKYKITRSPIYPYWYFWWYPMRSADEEVIKWGESTTNDQGKFNVEFTPKLNKKDKDLDEVSYSYLIEVDVINPGGETISEQKTFRVGKVGVKASISGKKFYFKSNKKKLLSINLTDINGVPTTGKAQATIYQLSIPDKPWYPAEFPKYYGKKIPEITKYHTKDDFKRTRWNAINASDEALKYYKSGKKIKSINLEHELTGIAKINLDKLKAGSYRIVYQTQDKYKNKYETQSEFILFDKHRNYGIPLVLKTNTNSVKVGEKLKLVFMSPYFKQKLYYKIYNKEAVLKEGVANNYFEFNHKVNESDRGGFRAEVFTFIDNKYYLLQKVINVPFDQKKIEISFENLRKIVEPGKKENFRVILKAKAKKDFELLAYMYDQSLDSFTSHSVGDIFSTFPSVRYQNTFSNSRAYQSSFYSSYSWMSLGPLPHLYGGSIVVLNAYPMGGMGRQRFKGRMMKKAMPMGALAEAEGVMADNVMESNRFDNAAQTAKRVDKDLKKEDAAPSVRDESKNKPKQQVRSNFSETAFFYPQLHLDKENNLSISYEVPDSLTTWNLWTIAHNKDLDFGKKKIELKSQKKLMVRSYLPRFFREGDEIKVNLMAENLTAENISAMIKVTLEKDEKNLASKFKIDKKFIQGFTIQLKEKESKKLVLPLSVPLNLFGVVKFKVSLSSKNYSDGELHELPLLPSRMHLFQSKFITLKNKEKRDIIFEDLLKKDPSRVNKKMVVKVDGQLFFSLLSSLPYLVNYPYECSEQTLNRFVSSGILKSIYDSSPELKSMAKKMEKRKTQFEAFLKDDPNRTITLEETPWLQGSRGGSSENLLNMLDPKIVDYQVRDSLNKLKKMQTRGGGFPWFPGGRPSYYMTSYVLYGFSKASEFNIKVPDQMIRQAFQFLKQEYLTFKENCMKKMHCYERVTFLNYLLSNFTNPSVYNSIFTESDRKEMLDYSFAHWKKHAPQLKGMLALTLKRYKRDKDANLVLDSVLDSAKQEKDLGVFWAPEDRSWLWYNDTIETHAMALRAIMEVKPKSKLTDGLVEWLFLNKKLNQWKSTKATAEVIYSVTKYLQKQGKLVSDEILDVKIGKEKKTFNFAKDEYTGANNFWVIPQEKFKPKAMSKISFEQKSKSLMFASAVWHYSTTKNPKKSKGDFFNITRKYFIKTMKEKKEVLVSLKEGDKIKVGDEVEVHLSINSKHQAEYVHVKDPRPSGFEPVSKTSGHKWNLGLSWYEEVRDTSTNFFFESVPTGEYTLKFSLRAALSGNFKSLPAKMESVYAPEFKAHSSGQNLIIQ